MSMYKARCMAYFVDCLCIGFLVAGIGYFIPVLKPGLLVFLLVAYIFKDCVFLDASIGKKVFKLRIVGEDGGRPSLKRVVLRNVPSLIFIGLEALQVKNGEQRLGDSLAETKIVFENREIT